MADIQSTTERLISQARKSGADSRQALLAETPNLQLKSAGTPLGLVSSGSDTILQALQNPGKRQIAQENQNRITARFNEQQDYERGQADKAFNYKADQDQFRNTIATNQDQRAGESQAQDMKISDANLAIRQAADRRAANAAAQKAQLDKINLSSAKDTETQRLETKAIQEKIWNQRVQDRKDNLLAQDNLKAGLKKLEIPTFASGEIDASVTESELTAAAKERGLDLSKPEVKQTLANELSETKMQGYIAKSQGLFDTYRQEAKSNAEVRATYENMQAEFGPSFTDDMVNSAVETENKYRETKAALPEQASTDLNNEVTAFTNEANIKLGTLQKQEAALIQQSDALGQELLSTASMTNDQKALKLKEVVTNSLMGDNKNQDNVDELLTDIAKLKTPDGKPLNFQQKLSFAKQASVNENIFSDTDYNNSSNTVKSIIGVKGTPAQQKERLGKLQAIFDGMSDDVLRYTASFDKMEQFKRDKLKIQNSIDNYKVDKTAEYKIRFSPSLSDKRK